MNSRQLFRDHESMLSGSSAAQPIAPNGLVWLAGGGGAVAAEAALAQREGRLVQCEKLLPLPGAKNGGQRQGEQAKQETARGLGSFQRNSFVERAVATAAKSMAQLLAAERAAVAAVPKEQQQQQQVRSDGVALWKSAQRMGSMGRQHEAAHLYREAIAKEAAASAGAGAKDGGGGGGSAARLGTLHYHLAHSLLAGQQSEMPRALAAAERALALLPQVRGPFCLRFTCATPVLVTKLPSPLLLPQEPRAWLVAGLIHEQLAKDPRTQALLASSRSAEDCYRHGTEVGGGLHHASWHNLAGRQAARAASTGGGTPRGQQVYAEALDSIEHALSVLPGHAFTWVKRGVSILGAVHVD
jgi:hypothetical protein